MSQNDFKTSEIIEPQEASPMQKLSVVGIDIAKKVFHLVGMWSWPHDSGHMWEALSPHPSYSF
jgi:hypothetical protein